VAEVSLVLGHGEGGHRPATVPCGLFGAEAEDAAQAAGEQVGGFGVEAVGRVPAPLGGLQQAALGQPAQCRPRARLADVELRQQVDQGGRRQVLRAVEPVVTEDRDEQVLWPTTRLCPGQAAMLHHGSHHTEPNARHRNCHGAGRA